MILPGLKTIKSYLVLQWWQIVGNFLYVSWIVTITITKHRSTFATVSLWWSKANYVDSGDWTGLQDHWAPQWEYFHIIEKDKARDSKAAESKTGERKKSRINWGENNNSRQETRQALSVVNVLFTVWGKPMTWALYEFTSYYSSSRPVNLKCRLCTEKQWHVFIWRHQYVFMKQTSYFPTTFCLPRNARLAF